MAKSYGLFQPSPYPGRRLLRAINLSKNPTLFEISLEEQVDHTEEVITPR
jgi:hypothetical protein